MSTAAQRKQRFVFFVSFFDSFKLLNCQLFFVIPLDLLLKTRRKLRNVARVYAEANASRPKDYWNYEALQVDWG